MNHSVNLAIEKVARTGIPFSVSLLFAVDSVGYFLPSSQGFLASKYDLGEVERELSAQVE